MRKYLYLLSQYIDLNAGEFPQHPAIIQDGLTLSWKDYSDYSTLLAFRLSENLKTHSKAFLIADKTPLAYIAIAACLKAGITYIPVDPNMPKDRLALLLKTAKPDGLLLGDDFSALKDFFLKEGSALSPDFYIEELSDNSKENPEKYIYHFFNEEVSVREKNEMLARAKESISRRSVTEKDIAYIMFTSGTTGIPKGVMISRRALLNYSLWAADHSRAKKEDVVFGHTPLNFDVSVYAFGASIVSGASLAAIRTKDEQNIAYLKEALEKQKISIWISAPSLLSFFNKTKMLEKLRLPDLRIVSYAAEVLPNKTLINWMKKFPSVEFHNLYGPTEATVTCLGHYYPVAPQEDDAIPIGLPHKNVEIFLVDEDNRIIEQPDTNGEIVIHSPGVSVGYFEDEKLTEEKFVNFGVSSSFQRAFKTGDLAYRNKEGVYFFLGRKDNQVKIRGYRIELGEIEFVLNQHKEVLRSVVFAVFAKKFDQKLLVAFVESREDLREADLRFHCSQKLSSYMVPFKILVHKDFPSNASGKIDRKKLFSEAEKLLSF